VNILISKNRTFCFYTIVFFTLLAPMNALSNSLTKVAVIPFTVNAEKDYTYLQNGITEMLTFHLSKQGKTKVIDPERIAEAMKDSKGTLTSEKAEKIGKDLEADYIVYGSVSVFGNHVNVQGKVLDLKGSRLPVLLSKELSSVDGIIPEINGFASEINKAFFNTDSQQEHTKDALESEKSKNTDSSSIITHHGSQEKAMSGFWKSEPIETIIHSLAVGDTDNDGIKEIVILSPHAVDIYQIQQDRLVKKQMIFSDDDLNLISIDIADINGNGFAEIFVTSLNALKNSVSSLVIEYNQGGYIKIVEDTSWYFKVVEHPTLGKQLLGQMQRTGRADIFSGAIVRMTWKNGQYEPTDPVLPENTANTLGFAFGRLLNTAEDICVVVTRNNSLQAIDSSGNRCWSGKGPYAPLPFYFLLPKEEPGVENRQYYPMRVGINNAEDGKNQLVVINNPNHSGSLLSFFSSNDQSHIEGFSWDGMDFVSSWETRNLSGTITSFVIDDVDQDGKKELVAGLILETGTDLGGHPKSVLVSYDLKQIKK
jgi:TolB-like protein